ncbi:MAG: MFS transporter [Thermoplasmata archaeon]|jgi:MFS family permease|nr:MFS transporter [Thermoplasmatales archaeon]
MSSGRYRWTVLTIMSSFLVIQAADTYILSAVSPQLITEFHISYEDLGLLFTSTLIIATVLYPVWGYLYDKYSRKFLTSIMALVLGATTWLNALTRAFSQFFITRLLTAIGYPVPSGVFTLTSDYFEPRSRGKAMGFINAATPIGYLLGIMIPLLIIGAGLSWRYSFFITGGISLIIGVMVYALIKEIPRGSSEPELEGKLVSDIYKVRLSDLKKILKNRSLLFLFFQGFFGVFPWTIISYWIITYMSLERGLPDYIIMAVMLIWIILMVAGNIISGYMSDFLFRKTRRGRAILGASVVFLSAILIYLTMYSGDFSYFFIFGSITAFVIPMAGPSVNAAVMDITEPELRGSATAYLNLFGNLGSSVAPLMGGILGEAVSLQYAITLVSVIAWIICGILFTVLIFTMPRDVEKLREILRRRGEELNRTAKIY